MYSIAKRLTSAVVAGAVVIGTLAVYPKISGNRGTTVVNADAPQVYDSASSMVQLITVLLLIRLSRLAIQRLHSL